MGIKKRYFRVQLSYATFGIISLADVVTEVAPIASWMRGKSLKEVKPWLLKKKAKVCELNMVQYQEIENQDVQ